MAVLSRVQLKPDGTRRRTGGEVKGKLANGVGSQYSSHYLGTWCIQHYYRWCAHLGCAAVDWTDAPADLNGLVRFGERINLVSARVPSRFKRTIHKSHNTRFMFNNLFSPRKSYPLWENVGVGGIWYSRTGQIWHNMAHAHCILDDKGYRHKLRLRNTYCIFIGNKGYANAPQYYVYKCITCLVYKIKSTVLCADDYLSVCRPPLPVFYQASTPQPVDTCHVRYSMSCCSGFKPNWFTRIIQLTSAQPL